MERPQTADRSGEDRVDLVTTESVVSQNPLQSVGKRSYENTGAVFESFATVLVLQGRTLDGEWHILDLARMPNETNYDYDTGASSTYALYTDDKVRVDRTVTMTSNSALGDDFWRLLGELEFDPMERRSRYFDFAVSRTVTQLRITVQDVTRGTSASNNASMYLPPMRVYGM